MRILFIAPEFPPDHGGIETYSLQLFDACLKLGADIQVLTLESYKSAHTDPRIHCALDGNAVNDRLVLKDLLAKESFDWIHSLNYAYSWTASMGYPASSAVHGNDILSPRHVFNFRLRRVTKLPFGDNLSFLFSREITRQRLKREARALKVIFPNSRWTAGLCRTILGGELPRVVVLNPGVAFTGNNSPILGRNKATDATRVILSVCRLSEPRKKIDAVLQALALIKDRNWTYEIVGDGALRLNLIALANQLGIADRVRFHGRVSDEALQEAYRRADLFILTPVQEAKTVEGFGIVYLEANVFGLPVLAARTGGIEDAVCEGSSGFFVEQVSATAIARALTEWLDGKRLFNAETVRAHAEKFTWASRARCFLDELSACVKER